MWSGLVLAFVVAAALGFSVPLGLGPASLEEPEDFRLDEPREIPLFPEAVVDDARRRLRFRAGLFPDAEEGGTSLPIGCAVPACGSGAEAGA